MARDMDGGEVREPFLDKSANRSNVDKEDTTTDQSSTNDPPAYLHSKRCHRRPSGIPTKHVLFHIILVALYTCLSALTVYALRYEPTFKSSQKYSPPSWVAEASLKPVATIFHDVSQGTSPYAGAAPNASIDMAWSSLLSPSHMRASDDELTLSGARSSVRLTTKSEGDNLVTLGAFNELSCLKLIREQVYSAAYHANKVGPLVDQCIETLRQTVMCSPDLSWTTFDWDKSSSGRVVVDNRYRVRECVDWDNMVRSLEGRRVSSAELEDILKEHSRSN